MGDSYTVIRIKRSLDVEPSDSIIVNAKRRRLDSTSTTEDKVSSTVLWHAGTLQTEDKLEQEKITKLLHGSLYERYRDDYKKKPSVSKKDDEKREQSKKNSSISRYKIINTKRGIVDEEVKEEPETSEEKKMKLYDAVHQDILQQPGFGSADDVITCNGVALTKEKKDFVYDYYFTADPVVSEEWNDNVLEIEHVTEYDHSNPQEYNGQSDPDDDDENAEENWRNDYPDEDEDELLYESEEEYLIHQINKFSMYDSEESYDADVYDENDDFDDEGNLIRASDHLSSNSMLKTFAHRISQQYDDDEDSD